MKSFLKEVVLPAGLWIYFLVKAVLTGQEVAHRDLGPLEPLPPEPFAVVLALCLLMGLVFPFLNAKLQSARLDRFFERLLGKESFLVISRRLNPNMLAGVFFLMTAAGGLYEGLRAGELMPVNRQMLHALTAIPAGIVAGLLWRRRNP